MSEKVCADLLDIVAMGIRTDAEGRAGDENSTPTHNVEDAIYVKYGDKNVFIAKYSYSESSLMEYDHRMIMITLFTSFRSQYLKVFVHYLLNEE